MKPRLGLAVPGLEQNGGGGGIASVARFLKNTALRCGAYDLTLISLATSARDRCNLSVIRPKTWLRGATFAHGMWEGLPLVHVGAVAGEPEFRRYLPRRVLTETIANCDIVQVVCGSPAYANAVCGLGKPVSIQCATRAKVERRRRDARPPGLAGWWGKTMTEFTDRLEERALRSADAIQVENSWMYSHTRKLNEGREVDLRYAPPGVDSHTFFPIRERSLNGDSYALCVGRLDDPRKNVELLLDAYARTPERVRNNVRLLLAGEAGPSVSFWQRAEALGLKSRIDFVHHPSRDELIALYQRAGMFVLASDEEGLGIVLLEAMACGIPVVSTRSGGPDGIITDGDDGFLVPLDDPAALAGRIEELYVNPTLNRSMGSRARLTIERRFSAEIAEAAFLDVWERLLQRRKTHTCAE